MSFFLDVSSDFHASSTASKTRFLKLTNVVEKLQVNKIETE